VFTGELGIPKSILPEAQFKTTSTIEQWIEIIFQTGAKVSEIAGIDIRERFQRYFMVIAQLQRKITMAPNITSLL
jgi:hypothetical protein